MSFVDELRNCTPSSIDQEMLEVCISAIRNACMSAKNQRNVKGYIYYYNDDGYGLEGVLLFIPKMYDMLAKEDTQVI